MSHATDDDAGTESDEEQQLWEVVAVPCDQLVDEMDVEEHTWQYLLFKHANLLSDFAIKYKCGLELKHSLDSRGQIKSRVRVTAESKACLETGAEELVSLLQVLVDNDIQRCQVDLCWSEYFVDLEEELKNKEVLLLLSSPCYVVGPAGALNDAQSIVVDAVTGFLAANLPPVAGSDDDTKKDIFRFRIPQMSLTVHVRQGTWQLV